MREESSVDDVGWRWIADVQPVTEAVVWRRWRQHPILRSALPTITRFDVPCLSGLLLLAGYAEGFLSDGSQIWSRSVRDITLIVRIQVAVTILLSEFRMTCRNDRRFAKMSYTRSYAP